jgi:hypothetical protein
MVPSRPPNAQVVRVALEPLLVILVIATGEFDHTMAELQAL